MYEDLRTKTEELVINVYKLAIASDSVTDVNFADVEPDLAKELNDVAAMANGLLTMVNQLGPAPLNGTDKVEYVKKINKIIDDTDVLDSRILAMPRPKSRVGRPKYYEGIHALVQAIDNIIAKITEHRQNYPNPVPTGQPGADNLE